MDPGLLHLAGGAGTQPRGSRGASAQSSALPTNPQQLEPPRTESAYRDARGHAGASACQHHHVPHSAGAQERGYALQVGAGEAVAATRHGMMRRIAWRGGVGGNMVTGGIAANGK